MQTSVRENTGLFLAIGENDPSLPPVSFPIDPEPDSKGGPEDPQSFPIDPEPDSKSGIADDLPQSFPIDPEPDSSRAGS